MGVILTVEDDDDLRALIVMTLTEAGYQVIEANSGEKGLELIQTRAPDLVLLDINLGTGIDGLEVCRLIRKRSDVPILFLTTRADEIDQLIGLTLGADDYITKPISPRLLAARVGATLRRGTSQSTQAEVIQIGDFTIDLSSRTCNVKDASIDLTRIQFDLLVALAENPTRVLSREQLVERVWGEWFSDDSNLDVHLSRLRSRITDAGGPRIAYAVRGFGYKLQA